MAVQQRPAEHPALDIDAAEAQPIVDLRRAGSGIHAGGTTGGDHFDH